MALSYVSPTSLKAATVLSRYQGRAPSGRLRGLDSGFRAAAYGLRMVGAEEWSPVEQRNDTLLWVNHSGWIAHSKYRRVFVAVKPGAPVHKSGKRLPLREERASALPLMMRSLTEYRERFLIPY